MTFDQRVARRAGMLADLAGGMARCELGQKYGLSYPQVCKIVKCAPLPGDQPRGRASPERVAQIVALLREGHTYAHVGFICGLSRQRVFSIAKAAGYEGKRCLKGVRSVSV